MAGQPAPGHDEAAVLVAPAADRLLDLLRADPELLALEFELIVESEWDTDDLSTSAERPDPRPPRQGCAIGTRRAPLPWHGGSAGPEPAADRARAARRRARARQRGPPPAGAHPQQSRSRTRR